MTMKKNVFLTVAFVLAASVLFSPLVSAADEKSEEYKVGVGDVLEISVLQPDQFITNVTVAPDGYITFPYIGNVKVKGLNLPQIQEEIRSRLADGYVKYPMV